MARGRKRKGFGDKEVDGVEDKQNQYLGRPLTELPAHISLNILVKLSVKQILICKRVCKTWRNIISSPEFAKLHFARGETVPLLRSSAPSRVSRTLFLVEPPEHCSGFDDGPVKMKLDTKLKIPVYDEETVIESVEMDPPPKSGVKLRAEHHELKVVNSCNGLLCLCEPNLDFPGMVWRNPIAVCNPITGEYINLPDPIEWDRDTKRSLSIHCGLGFSPKMNQYKVIRFREAFFSREGEIGSMTEIHTLGTGSWKRVFNVPSSLYYNKGSPTYLNGSLHWIYTEEKGSNSIVSFNFDNENFQSVPPPPFKICKSLMDMNAELVLGVLRGCLSVCDGSGFEKLKIWVMKEYGVQESWSKEFCFITQTNEGRWIYGTYDPICLLRNGAVVLFHSLSGALFYHDPKKHGFKFLKPQDGFKTSKYVAIAHISSFISLKDVVKAQNMAVLPTKSRCVEFKLQGECKDVFLVEEDPAMTWY
ncbi:hypothetical protein RHSIM_Rhsim07G0064200 [Rhododendron simsii]|uniref:F-box domain-containing protein n=1 Tax=Rhododendron simsii TaxID=118357 RepID=A0A834LI24_RHOSS|nr:hypothetical protein RHSIM_Rhsim07G0064200 [Rhododendron simsii]